MYQYSAKVIKVIDGDTVKLDVDLGFHLTRNNQNFRLMGIDTPETRGEERQKGLLCKEFVQKLLPVGSEVCITTYKPDKYGRWLVDIVISTTSNNDETKMVEVSLSEYLINKGYAKKYNGSGIVDFPLNEKYPLERN